MKTIYIHIGPHKTGTKTIQRGLRKNQSQLERNGYRCPRSGQLYSRFCGNFLLGYELSRPRQKEKHTALKDIAEEISSDDQHSRVILSAENFENVPPSGIKALKKALEPAEFRVVLYPRRQDKILQSHWMQEIKNPEMPPPPTFREYIEQEGYRKNFRDYGELIDAWGDVFGRENMRVRVLEREQLTHGDLFHDFLVTCDVETPERYKRPGNENESPGTKTLEAMLLFKVHLYGKVDKGFLRRLFILIKRHADTQGWDERSPDLVDADVYELIRARFVDSNHRIAQEFFGRENLFLESYVSKGVNPFNRDDFTKEELQPLFFWILRNLAEDRHTKSEGRTDEDLRQANRKLQEELNRILSSRAWRVVSTLRDARKSLCGIFWK